MLTTCARAVCAPRGGGARYYLFLKLLTELRLPRGRRCALVFLCRVRGSNPRCPACPSSSRGLLPSGGGDAAPGLFPAALPSAVGACVKNTNTQMKIILS